MKNNLFTLVILNFIFTGLPFTNLCLAESGVSSAVNQQLLEFKMDEDQKKQVDLIDKKYEPLFETQREEIRKAKDDLQTAKRSSKASSSDVIEKNKSGVWYVMGGKYTTYRAIAQDCVEKILEGKKLNLGTEYALYGNIPVDGDIADKVRQCGFSDQMYQYLFSKYGYRVSDVLDLVLEDRTLAEPLCTCSLAIRAQVVYGLKNEMAVTADDLIWRRLGIGYRYCGTRNCRRIIAQYCRQ